MTSHSTRILRHNAARQQVSAALAECMAVLNGTSAAPQAPRRETPRLPEPR